MRGRWIAWCATAGLWLGALGALPGSARAEDNAPVAYNARTEDGAPGEDKARAEDSAPGDDNAPAEDNARTGGNAPSEGNTRSKDNARAKDDAPESAGERAAREVDRTLRRVAGTQHMEVLARDLRLTDTNAQRLKRIATRYYKATRERLVVTGGTRTPQRQARLMYDKLKHGDDIVAQYENKQAALEIRNMYRDGEARRLSRARQIRAIKGVIEAQMARGVFVSKHLQSGAVDVRSWNMEGKREEALRDAVKQEPGVTLMDERSGPEPHFHLNLLTAP